MYKHLSALLAVLLLCCARVSCNRALIVVNTQYCLLPGGSRAIETGDAAIPAINALRAKFDEDFDVVVLTQQYHCPDHVSFASSHNLSPGQNVTVQYNAQGQLCKSPDSQAEYAVNCAEGDAVETFEQPLFHDHCVGGTADGALSKHIMKKPRDRVVQTSLNCARDSHSAFENPEFEEALESNETKIESVIICGLGVSNGISATAMDAVKKYTTFVVVDASYGTSAQSNQAAFDKMHAAGVRMVTTEELNIIVDPDYVGPDTSVKMPPWWQVVVLFIVVGFLVMGIVGLTFFLDRSKPQKSEKARLNDREIVLEAS